MKISVCISNANTLSKVHIDMRVYTECKQIIRFMSGILAYFMRIFIREATPWHVKAGSKSILCSKASNQQKKNSECVSGVEQMSYEVCVSVCLGLQG